MTLNQPLIKTTLVYQRCEHFWTLTLIQLISATADLYYQQYTCMHLCFQDSPGGTTLAGIRMEDAGPLPAASSSR